MNESFVNKIFGNPLSLGQTATTVFQFQYNNNPVYKLWCNALNIEPSTITSIQQIPFLPISFFKTQKIICEDENYETVFESSGTTQTSKSRHFIKHTDVYKQSFLNGFNLFYGDVKEWCIIGLLPSYLQQKNSSLVFMVDELIRQSNHPTSGFYLDDFNALHHTLLQLEKLQQKTLLIGVTYALIDFAEQFPMKLSATTIMETGGMKGRRKELTRNEVHDILEKQWQVNYIHSEYGMTELLSQAYAKSDGIFYCPRWMKVFVRDEEDPLNICETGKGILNVIDLANLYSCAFIATDDAGEVFEDGSFSVYGRVDNSDMRGCSLMAV